jgi:demethylmenaquinone methyltransferase/2-methoxy-6-polyprenyl-1,4-benzoquinol methylase
MPVFAKLASTNDEAYTYLADSIAAWPDQQTLASWVRDAGFHKVGFRNLTGGIVAMHRGVKPL